MSLGLHTQAARHNVTPLNLVLYGFASNMKEFTIRQYKSSDELGWLQCRVLAFLETAYFDDVRTEKETYQSDSIELIAECCGTIVGLIDVEVEDTEEDRSGMIWHVAVHPEYRRQGIAKAMLESASEYSRKKNLARLEAWTRDDKFVNDWYRSQGFREIQSYYHVYANQSEIRDHSLFEWPSRDTYTMSAFFHYLGEDQEFLSKFKRVHQCRRYDLHLQEQRAV